ncbi:MAG: hypothetical protein K5694_01380 [Bacilli bacterium]|nr:hypothetical protein [Bacilli bacterium]
MAKKRKSNRGDRYQRARDVSISLPTSYPKLFKLTYRTNLLLIFKSSLILSVFAIPLFIALYIRGRIVSGLTASEDAERIQNIMSFQGWYGFIILLAFLIFSIGVIGVLYVMNRHIRNEGVIFLRDFFAGIKKNWLGGIGITTLYLGTLAVFNYILNLLSFKSEIPYYAILLVIFIIVSVIVYMMWVIALMTHIIYTTTLGQLIKNSFLMVFAKLPLCLFSAICTIAPFIVVWIIGFAPVLYAVTLVYVAIGFGNSALVVALINCHIFDELVNKKQFPEAYRLGLFSEGEVKDEGFEK